MSSRTRDAMALQRAITTMVAAVALIAYAGCATARGPLQRDGRLRTVGVVASIGARPFLEVPAKGSGAGAGRGAAAGAMMFAPVPLLAPLGAAIGAAVGAGKAEEAEKVERAQSTLMAALDRLRPQQAVRDRFFEAVREHSGHSFVPLAGPLETDGVDAVLELTVRECRLHGNGPINPPFVLLLRVRTRLVRVADGVVIEDEGFTYESKKRKFVEWARDDARPLHDEMERAAVRVARDIAVRLLR